MAKTGLLRLRPLMFWLTPITRSPAQKPAHKDFGRNDQSPVITPKATYAPVSNRAGSRSLNCRLQSKSKKFSCEFSV
ncbi:Malolactic regulator [Lacticaseibacillus rhamnosus]